MKAADTSLHSLLEEKEEQIQGLLQEGKLKLQSAQSELAMKAADTSLHSLLEEKEE